MTDKTETSVDTAEELINVYDEASQLYRDGKKGEAVELIREKLGDAQAEQAKEAMDVADEVNKATKELEKREESPQQEDDPA